MEGNRSKTPLPKGEPAPEAGAPPRPRWLSKAAQREWNRLVRELEPVGLLTRVDGEALAHYCDLHAQAIQIAAEMAKPEFRPIVEEIDTHIGESGEGTQMVKARVNPLYRISLQLKQQLRLMLIEFGMTPAARSRVKTAHAPERSKLERFLNG